MDKQNNPSNILENLQELSRLASNINWRVGSIKYHLTYDVDITDRSTIDFDFINEEMKAIDEFSSKVMKLEIEDYEFLVDAYGKALYVDIETIKSHAKDLQRNSTQGLT
ncbi:hypothetical protein [Halobacillus sp. BBL2006]|uniref:hypothetical protein n=1 Tax=Halobacillus sp. BBL2006 TaxID=1543706 RepID=UPI0005437740|nr:hypothetical protein [Halobacillus sp. BBL2006]KHE72347.1 hypothetical protein LD39_05015 [Halobacillus sp. BBL2006]